MLCQYVVRAKILQLTYGDLKDELLAAILGLEGVENSWELLGIELNCNTVLAPIMYTRPNQLLLVLRLPKLLEVVLAEFAYHRRRHQ